ncbi:beta-1,4-xylosyltransferase IRX9-like [Aristolochia californica]|uniref:beta-1,4-xylosyltransferase IRX9-like n=1 Tax=Aristolochia californica TaxID=171875 RepID=UPI0035DDBF5E
MGSFDRSKKRIQVWKKAAFHFSLCFVMGLFTGFAPSKTTNIFSSQVVANSSIDIREFSPPPLQGVEELGSAGNSSRSLMGENPVSVNDSELVPVEEEALNLTPKKLLIIITTTTLSSPLQGALLMRLGHTLKLVPPPLLWIVVEPQSETSENSQMLRKTGIMYRHLVSKENFTELEAEVDHQRNVALNHIEHHRLDGIVHFASISNYYDLQFFEYIREVEVFGKWPIALLSANRQRVVMEGPSCSSSQVQGWHFQNPSHHAAHDSSFAFNSSVLWDPERWGRTTSTQDSSQDSLKFIQQVVMEDEGKLRGMPRECSKILLWYLNTQNLSHFFSLPLNQTRR